MFPAVPVETKTCGTPCAHMVEQHRHNTARDTQRSLRMLDFLLGIAWREKAGHTKGPPQSCILDRRKEELCQVKSRNWSGVSQICSQSHATNSPHRFCA